MLYGGEPKNLTPLRVCVCVFTPSSLTTDQGTDLMEHLTQRLSLHVADLTQLSYVQTQKTSHIVANNDLPCRLQTIHRTEDNWPHLKCFVLCL